MSSAEDGLSSYLTTRRGNSPLQRPGLRLTSGGRLCRPDVRARWNGMGRGGRVVPAFRPGGDLGKPSGYHWGTMQSRLPGKLIGGRPSMPREGLARRSLKPASTREAGRCSGPRPQRRGPGGTRSVQKEIGLGQYLWR